MAKSRFLIQTISLILMILLVSFFYLQIGPQHVDFSQLFSNSVVLDLRLPRLISLYLVAILLSSSGFLVQLLTRNPIAEMTTLGISGGASFALSLLMVLGLATGGFTAILFASAGAIAALFIVLFLTQKSKFHPLKLVLVGTSIGLFTTSLASALTFSTHDTQSYFLWIVGSFSGITALKLEFLAGTVVIFLLLLFFYASQINLLALGDDMAKSLGVSVNFVRFVMMFLVAIASGVTVASVGVIAFVGLIAPHIARYFGAHGFWDKFALSNLTGILLLMICDFIAKNAFAPYEFPVGALCMLCGGIFFLILLKKELT